MPNIVVDARGLRCPIPIAKISAKITHLQPGDLLEILADDHPFVKDVMAYCEVSGNELVSLEESNGAYKAVIKKA